METSKIKIGFSTTNSIVSRAIRWFTKSAVSHCFILFEDSFLGCDLLLEASAGGFQVMRFDVFAAKNRVVRLVPLSQPILYGVQEATRWLGDSYDYLGLVGSAVMMVARWAKRKIKNPLHAPRSMFCSEAIVRALQTANYPGASGLDPASVTPEDLLEFLEGPAKNAES